jgi:MoxR-like ATPase
MRGKNEINKTNMALKKQSKASDVSLFAEMNPKQRIQEIISYMTNGLYEKEHIMMLTLLCVVAGESIFLLGPPGTAKSLVARRLKMVFKGASSFEYLMSRFSTPDEIFGPVSISKLKNEDKYERVVSGYLPDADVVFLDEIWKAGPAIQNALLTAINERIYQNGSNLIHLPMKVLIAASNELPAENEGLEALWDRFIVRTVSNCIVNEKAFYKMLRDNTVLEITIPESLLLTNEILSDWQSKALLIEIPDDVLQTVTNIRKMLQEQQKKEGVNKMDFHISDRRWKKAFKLMRTSAFLNQRNAVHITDLVLLIHCLWNTTEGIPIILDIVCGAFTLPIIKGIEKLEMQLNHINSESESSASVSAELQRNQVSDEENQYQVSYYFFYTIERFPKNGCRISQSDCFHISETKDTTGLLFHDKKGWIIHAIYIGSPFEYKRESLNEVQKVTLRKCRGGIIVDGIPYAFRKKISASDHCDGNSNRSDFELLAVQYASLAEQFKLIDKNLKLDNLFVSLDDRNLINRHLSSVKRKLDVLNVKINNSMIL